MRVKIKSNDPELKYLPNSMAVIRLIFDDIKPISKQKGYGLGYHFVGGRKVPCKFQTVEYKAFKNAAGMIALAESRKQGWNGPKSCEIAVFGYFYCPRSMRGQDLADNAFSGFLDAFEGVIYENDRQITRAYYERHFTREMLRVELVFAEL